MARAKPKRVLGLSLAERFWSKVDRSGGPSACWLWLLRRNGKGYGFVRVGSLLDGTRTNKLAHRVAWELERGPIPAGLAVCHACDVPACCNPAHLWLGTRADNNRDMFAKGRNYRGPRVGFVLRGEKAPGAKLTARRVRRIRALYAAGDVSQDALAKRFGVAQTLIGHVVRGTRWGHVL